MNKITLSDAIAKKTVINIDEIEDNSNFVISYIDNESNKSGLVNLSISSFNEGISNMFTEIINAVENLLVSDDYISYLSTKIEDTISENIYNKVISYVKENEIKNMMFNKLFNASYTNLWLMDNTTVGYCGYLGDFDLIKSNITTYNLYDNTYSISNKNIISTDIMNGHTTNTFIYNLGYDLEYCYNNSKYIIKYTKSNYIDYVHIPDDLLFFNSDNVSIDDVSFVSVLSYTTISPDSNDKLFVLYGNKFSTIYNNYVENINDMSYVHNIFMNIQQTSLENCYNYYKDNVYGKDDRISLIRTCYNAHENSYNEIIVGYEVAGVITDDEATNTYLTSFVTNTIKRLYFSYIIAGADYEEHIYPYIVTGAQTSAHTKYEK